MWLWYSRWPLQLQSCLMVFEGCQATNNAFKHPSEAHSSVRSICLSWVCVTTVRTDNINVTNIDFPWAIQNLMWSRCVMPAGLYEVLAVGTKQAFHHMLTMLTSCKSYRQVCQRFQHNTLISWGWWKSRTGISKCKRLGKLATFYTPSVKTITYITKDCLTAGWNFHCGFYVPLTA